QRVGASAMTKNFILLLLDKDRMGDLPAIVRELRVMLDERANRVHAVVTSARPLSAKQEADLVKALQKVSGKSVTVEKQQDPKLLGGVVAQVGDVVYDGSLRTQLENLRQTLGGSAQP